MYNQRSEEVNAIIWKLKQAKYSYLHEKQKYNSLLVYILLILLQR